MRKKITHFVDRKFLDKAADKCASMTLSTTMYSPSKLHADIFLFNGRYFVTTGTLSRGQVNLEVEIQNVVRAEKYNGRKHSARRLSYEGLAFKYGKVKYICTDETIILKPDPAKDVLPDPVQLEMSFKKPRVKGKTNGRKNRR